MPENTEATALSVVNAPEALELPANFGALKRAEQAALIAGNMPATVKKKDFVAMLKRQGLKTCEAERRFYASLKEHRKGLAVYLEAARQALGNSEVARVKILKGGDITAKFSRPQEAGAKSSTRVNAAVEAAEARAKAAEDRIAKLEALLSSMSLPAEATARVQA